MLNTKERAIIAEIKFGIKTLIYNMRLSDEEKDIVSRLNSKLDCLYGILKQPSEIQYIEKQDEVLNCNGCVAFIAIVDNKAVLFDSKKCKEYRIDIKDNQFIFRRVKFDISRYKG